MRHTKTVAALAIAAGAMSGAAAHAVGEPGEHGQSGTTHGQSGDPHSNSGTHPNNGDHGLNGTHGQNGTHPNNGQKQSHANNSHSHGCHYRNVAWVAKGILEASGPSFDALGDGKFDVNDMSIQLTGGNRFGKLFDTLPQPLDLSNVRVVFALSELQPLDGVVNQSDVQPADRVQLIGKISWRPARCEQTVTQTATNTVTTNTDTTGTSTTAIDTPPEPVIRKVIFKDPSGSQGQEIQTETTSTGTTTTDTTTTGTTTATSP